MIGGFEFWLPIGAAGFLLWNSARLLYDDELMIGRRGDRWFADAATDLRVFGRRVYLMNPFMPHVPLWQVRWAENDGRGPGASDETIEHFLRLLRPLQWLVVVLALLLGIALPVASWGFGAGWTLLGVFAAYYVVALVAVATLGWRARALGLSRRQCLSIAFDSIACAPFAINLVRRVAQSRALIVDPLAFASSHFDGEALGRLQALVARVVAEDLLRESSGDDRRRELESFVARIGGDVR